MSVYSNAPLVEAIFEVRWDAPPLGSEEINPQPEESKFFFGKFIAAAVQKGYYAERVNPRVPDFMPHMVSYRFRTKPDTWPCYQIGTGIFTVNQINEGYDWGPFKQSILDGIDLLRKGHPSDITTLPVLHFELRYHDGFIFEEGEKPAEFLKNKFNIDFTHADSFLQTDLFEKDLDRMSYAFRLKSRKPVGILIFDLKEALIEGKPGFVTQAILRSPGKEALKIEKDLVAQWLEESHVVQKYIFSSLLDPAFAKRLK